MSFGHDMLMVQIPRYLELVTQFLSEKKVFSVGLISRNALFEHFIYEKVDLEDERSNLRNSAITKRLLEKLALTMEIFQTKRISKDEFITFLDELQSDLKLAALGQFDHQPTA
jgi:hypothetical protein